MTCKVCLNPEHRLINSALALAWSPRRVATKFRTLSRAQIDRHRRVCLGGDPLLAVARERGWLEEEGEPIGTTPPGGHDG